MWPRNIRKSDLDIFRYFFVFLLCFGEDVLIWGICLIVIQMINYVLAKAAKQKWNTFEVVKIIFNTVWNIFLSNCTLKNKSWISLSWRATLNPDSITLCLFCLLSSVFVFSWFFCCCLLWVCWGVFCFFYADFFFLFSSFILQIYSSFTIFFLFLI